MSILECSSRGDKRFSAWYARISVDGEIDCIENHYQKTKKYAGGNIIAFTFRGKNYKDLSLLTYFYYSLWYKYFILNKHLVEYAKKYDDYSDMFFKKGAYNCQADCVREIVKLGFKEYYNKYVIVFEKMIEKENENGE